MKTILRLAICFTIIFLTYSCFSDKKLADSKIIVLPLSDTITIREGCIVYGLPRTIFTMVVEMEETIEKPGPYGRYAGDFLGLDDVILNENHYWTIEGISVKQHQELDPSEFYIIESSTLFQTNVLALKNEGLILDLNPGVNYSGQRKSGISYDDDIEHQTFDLGSDEYFTMQRDTAYKRVNLDSAFIRIPYIVEKKKKLPLEQLAEKAAKRLMEMRDGKHLILTGEANVFPQNEAAIKEMNRLEKEYTELFTGKTLKVKRIISYQVIPAKEMAGKPLTVFQFSDLTGPVSGANKNGKPVMVEFVPEHKTKDLTVISKIQPYSEQTQYDKLFYRVPDVVNLKISLGNEVLYNSRQLIYQFGQVISLPANFIIGK